MDRFNPRFGDAVRVKAGTPVYADREDCSGVGCPNDRQFGKKLIFDSGLNILMEYLEPWKDDEIWDGSNWVKKKEAEKEVLVETIIHHNESLPPEFVIVKGIKYVPDPSYSVAEQVEKEVLGEIEKNSEQCFFNKPDWMAHVVGVTRTGNRLAITYDFGK